MQKTKGIKKYCFVLVILFAVCPVYSSTYFVDPNGNDSNSTPGTIDSPFKTIPYAVSKVVAGDTIYLRGGTHGSYTDANKISISKGGDANHPITMQNYQDEKPILDFSKETRGGSVRGIQMNSTANYWHLKGFTLRNAGDNGIYVQGSHNVLEQLIAYGNQDTGINLYASASGTPSYNLVLNCDSYLNYDPQNAGGNADGFGAKSPTGPTAYTLGPGNVFYGCRSWSNSDDGFDLWWAGKAVRIENCWAWRNGYNIWGYSPANNWKGNGEGIKLGQGPGAHKIFHCLAYYNRLGGFTLNRSGGDTEVNGVTVDNCTGIENQDNGSYRNFKFADHSPLTVARHVLHNNISYLGSVSMGTQMVYSSYNTWNSGFSVSTADFASIDANDLSKPRGPNGELPKVKFMRLSVSSALIDAGMDVNEPYNGSAPDLGAFEHIDGDCYTDGQIDLLDLKCLSDNWLTSNCGACNQADFSGDHNVNFYDFAIMAENWMK